MTASELDRAVRAHDHVRDLQRRLVDAHRLLAGSREAAERAARAAGEEAADVERLRGLTWTAVVEQVRGRRTTELEREEAELARARLEAGSAARRVERDAEEVARLQRELEASGGDRVAHDAVLAARHAWAQQHDPVNGPRLAEITETNAHLGAEQQRLAEAMEALGHADGWVAEAERATATALDLSGTGGLGTLMPWRQQFAAMDEAVRGLEHASAWARRTGAEVPEIGWALEEVSFSDGAKVFTAISEGPSDLFGHPRLKAALAHCARARAHLRHLDQGRRAHHHDLGIRREALADERVRLLAAGAGGDPGHRT